MRRLNNTGLTISGVVAISLLLAASGLMLLTIGSGTPGTWTPLVGDAVKEYPYGWPQPTAIVKSTARGRYGRQATTLILLIIMDVGAVVG